MLLLLQLSVSDRLKAVQDKLLLCLLNRLFPKALMPFLQLLLLKALKENGVHTAVDTCGFVPKTALDKVIPYTDIFLYDIKAYDENVHRKCTGQSNKQIIENLQYLDKKGCKVEIRIPYVPQFNDGEIEKIGEILNGLNNLTKVRVLPYHSYAGSKYEALEIENMLPAILPNEEETTKARERIKKVIRREDLPIK